MNIVKRSVSNTIVTEGQYNLRAVASALAEAQGSQRHCRQVR